MSIMDERHTFICTYSCLFSLQIYDILSVYIGKFYTKSGHTRREGKIIKACGWVGFCSYIDSGRTDKFAPEPILHRKYVMQGINSLCLLED